MTEQSIDGAAPDAKPSPYKDRSTWIRGLFMLLFVPIYNLATLLLGAVTLLQFGWKLVAGEPNPRLVRFGDSLGQFLYRIARFQTFNTEDKPFPFEDWPAPAD